MVDTTARSALSAFVRKVARYAVIALALLGAFVTLLSLWLALAGSTGIERLVIESNPPTPAAAIVLLTGGLGNHDLPTPEGWDRIYTAVQLWADGLAPTIIISGGGVERVSEAEVYAEAAVWLGGRRDSLVLDSSPGSTAEHPGNLLNIQQMAIHHDTALLVVTSRLHSRRAAMCFRKAGFVNFRLVTSHEAKWSSVARSDRRSSIASFKPQAKNYADPLNRLRWGLADTLTTLRELLAIAVYRYRGQA